MTSIEQLTKAIESSQTITEAASKLKMTRGGIHYLLRYYRLKTVKNSTLKVVKDE